MSAEQRMRFKVYDLQEEEYLDPKFCRVDGDGILIICPRGDKWWDSQPGNPRYVIKWYWSIGSEAPHD